MKGFFIRFSGELQTELLLSVRYWLESVALWTGFILAFVGLFFGVHLIGGGVADWGQEAAIRYTVWVLCLMAIIGLPQRIQEEAMTGVLEQRFLAPKGGIASLAMSAIGRLLFWLVGTTLIFFALLGITRTPLYFDWTAVLVAVLILIGAQGVGFFLGGLALLFKRIQAVTQLLQMVLLGVAMLPADRLPDFWQGVVQTLPLAAGLPVLNDILLGRVDFLTVVGRADFYALVLSSGVYLVVGLVSLRWAIYRARSRGLLAQY